MEGEPGMIAVLRSQHCTVRILVTLLALDLGTARYGTMGYYLDWVG